MDSQNLHLYVDFVGSSGVILSAEQKAALQTSLVILRNNHKFAHVKLWGKILGVKDDYYIAQGFTDNQLADKTTLYRFVRDFIIIIINNNNEYTETGLTASISVYCRHELQQELY